MTRIHPKSSRDKVRAQRAGLRLTQIWVPNVRTTSFAAKARRQSLAVARSVRAKADQAFIDAISGLD